MYLLAYRDIIRRNTISDEKLPEEFDGFRVFFISDIHRRRIKTSTLDRVTEKIDLVIIGGDLTEQDVPLDRTKDNLIKLKRWGAPIYFIWGNNDVEIGKERMESLLHQEGILTLSHDITAISRKNSTLSILGLNCGMELEEGMQKNWEQALGNYNILVTHVPDLFDRLKPQVKNKIHTILAGHTHGGQIRPMGFGPYEKGMSVKDKNNFKLISEGYGWTVLPFRLGTAAECHVIVFRNE